MLKNLLTLSQTLLPQHLLSRMVHYLADCENPWLKNQLIQWFMKYYQVDLSEYAVKNPEEFASFNEFFKRKLQHQVREMPKDDQAIISPADGSISQIGDIRYGRIIQAKQQDFSVMELLGGDKVLAEEFDNGQFATIYLSPKDYHRVHMPFAGTLRKMMHVPGRLFSVNQATSEVIPRLFARNERVVCLFDTPCGPMALVLVGAMIVASIETVWQGVVTPKSRSVVTTSYNQESVSLGRGEQMGAFSLGSTAIVLFAKDQVKWNLPLQAGQSIKMGDLLGNTVQ